MREAHAAGGLPQRGQRAAGRHLGAHARHRDGHGVAPAGQAHGLQAFQQVGVGGGEGGDGALGPGVGAVVQQGRALRGLVFFIATAVIWVITFGLGGWIGHLWACYDAAVWKGPKA